MTPDARLAAYVTDLRRITPTANIRTPYTAEQYRRELVEAAAKWKAEDGAGDYGFLVRGTK